MTPIVDVRPERVVLETDRYRVEGDITLPHGSYRNPLSEHINRSDEKFLYIVNAELVALDGSGRHWSTPVLMLAIRHIRSATLKD
jgi:hypothetical protein